MTTTKPLVAFSYDIFTAQKAGGVTRSMLELMRALVHLNVPWRGWAGCNNNAMLTESLCEPWAAANIESTQGADRSRVVASIIQEPQFAQWVRQEAPPVVHRTYYPVRDLLDRKSCRHVETLHDLWDERSDVRHDKGAPLRSWLKKRACHRADVIVCVSEYTREEAMDRWPQLANRILVIPHGVRRLAELPVPSGSNRPYFLFVGRRSLYKNFSVVAEALSRSGLSDHGLICFGGGSFSDSERVSLRERGISERVIQLTGTDDQLAGLYQDAVALVYPSVFEGFGLPLLEAMIHGCPVIASPLTSLPEVGGDAALYADPSRPEAWAETMRFVAERSDVAALHRDAGYARAAQFTWTNSAVAHADLYATLN